MRQSRKNICEARTNGSTAVRDFNVSPQAGLFPLGVNNFVRDSDNAEIASDSTADSNSTDSGNSVIMEMRESQISQTAPKKGRRVARIYKQPEDVPRRMPVFKWMSRSSRTMPFEENELDATDDWEISEETCATNREKKTLRRLLFKIDQVDVERRRRVRQQVLEELRIGPEHEDAVVSLKIRCLRACGLMGFMIAVREKTILVEEAPPRPFCHKVVKSLRFEAFVACLIIFNAFLIGADSYVARGAPKIPFIVVADHVLFVIFVLEIWLRIMAHSWVWLVNAFNLLDTLIILTTGVHVNYILEPLHVDASVIQSFSAVRVIRIARLCRAIRILPLVKELWLLVQGISACSSLLFWVFIILGFLHYAFALILVEEMKTSSKLAEDPRNEDLIGTIKASMFSLFQIMTSDNWSQIVRPIMLVQPETGFVFIAFMGLVGIVFWNLITAVVVQNAYQGRDNDKELLDVHAKVEQLDQEIQLRQVFDEADKDGSNCISVEEFGKVLGRPSTLGKLVLLGIDVDVLPEVFDLFDDGDGLLTFDEFTNGYFKLQAKPTSRDLIELKKQASNSKKYSGRIFESLEDSADSKLAQTERIMDDNHDNFNKLQLLTGELITSFERIGTRILCQSSKPFLPEIPEPMATLKQHILQHTEMWKVTSERRNDVHLIPMAPTVPSRLNPIPSTWSLQREQANLAEAREKLKLQEKPCAPIADPAKAKPLLVECKTASGASRAKRLEALSLHVDMFHPKALGSGAVGANDCVVRTVLSDSLYVKKGSSSPSTSAMVLATSEARGKADNTRTLGATNVADMGKDGAHVARPVDIVLPRSKIPDFVPLPTGAPPPSLDQMWKSSSEQQS
eukprot:TRINITY_DN23025_c0_g1_i1.p1 TRINITY_DN23025_c0_g1~~TRINITY_DN23025_c0_g1_i1.p1  ORF type:complete len:852 (+),score=118.39 TRINITY_DN23025_c0_g1_i1:100-2655(+)